MRLIGQQVVHGRRGAAVVDVLHLDTRNARELLHRQVLGRTDARRAIVQHFGGISLCRLDQVLHAVERAGGVHHDHVRRFGNRAHGDQVLHRVIGQLGKDVREHADDGPLNQHRVAVRRRLGHEVVADVARGAWPVVDDHGLAQQRAQPLGHHARQDIGSAARRKRHDQLDGPCGPGRLRQRPGGSQWECG